MIFRTPRGKRCLSTPVLVHFTLLVVYIHYNFTVWDKLVTSMYISLKKSIIWVHCYFFLSVILFHPLYGRFGIYTKAYNRTMQTGNVLSFVAPILIIYFWNTKLINIHWNYLWINLIVICVCRKHRVEQSFRCQLNNKIIIIKIRKFVSLTKKYHAEIWSSMSFMVCVLFFAYVEAIHQSG